jgi:RecB family exonuclease
VRWFVERLLSPQPLVPDPEPMLRGTLAHRVLEQALRGLGGALTEERLDEARALLHEALEEGSRSIRISVNPERLRAQLRRLEVDLLAYLDQAARSGTAFAPEGFEVSFGGTEDTHPALELAGGALRLQGKIDRLDRRGDEAIVVDYKGKSGGTRGERWLQDGKLQVGLYMLAVRQVLGLEPVGGFYQPLGAEDGRPRGALRDDADPGREVVRGDRIAGDALEALLSACAEAAREAVDAIRAGALAPAPERCGWGGSGCRHPSICRCVQA